MSEQPAASINCGFTAGGLPIGLQISGRRFDDLGVLRLAHAYEDLRGVQRPWPEPPEPSAPDSPRSRPLSGAQPAGERPGAD